MKHAASLTLARPPKNGRAYAKADRARIIEHAVKRRAEGVGIARIAREAGVAIGTLKKWLATGAFEPVEVIAVERAGYTVFGPCGLRVEGVGIAEIADLMRRLA